MRRLGGVMWHTGTYFHSLIDVCDRFLERTKWSRSGAWPGRELFITRLGLGAHGGANGLVPLLPTSLSEPDKAIRIALGERHAEKCAMRKTLSGGFWIVSQLSLLNKLPFWLLTSFYGHTRFLSGAIAVNSISKRLSAEISTCKPIGRRLQPFRLSNTSSFFSQHSSY